MTKRVRISAAAALLAAWLLPSGAAAQDYMPPNYRYGQSYSDWYNEQTSRYQRPPASPRDYTYDTYFLHRPTVSPYLNLVRPQEGYTPNYFAYVVPEMQRREQAASLDEQLFKARAGVGAAVGGGGMGVPLRTSQVPTVPAPAAATQGQYYNHWYGGWAGQR